MVSAAISIPASTGTARRVRRHMATSQNCTVMATVVCCDCAAEFQITHRMPLQDKVLAQRQASWLAEQLVWDHIQEGKHRATIELPNLMNQK